MYIFDIAELTTMIDTFWLVFGIALVFLMQSGFLMLEVGLTRAKNSGNIIMKNTLDFAMGSLAYLIVGYGLMFGASKAGFFGGDGFLGLGILNYGGAETAAGAIAFFIFQTMFCATAATIVGGAMAERTKFGAYLIYCVVISAFIYPISGHWIWGGGWLSELGFIDFAGSTAVHLVGGLSALIGVLFLGPRIGKYDEKGKPKAILGHSLPLTAVGALLLWLGWFGFNGVSTGALSGGGAVTAATVIMNTNLAASAGAVATMLFTWFKYKKPDVSMTLNGALAGLVGITAGCAVVDALGAVIIGIIAGILVVIAVEVIDQKVKADDPVGAIAVHGVCGAFGTLAVGLFAVDGGVFYGGGFEQLGIQALGVIAVTAWIILTVTPLFFIIKKTVGIRVHMEEELQGLDISEHGLVSAYADFAPLSNSIFTTDSEPIDISDVPVNTKKADGSKISKITIVINENKFDKFKAAMNKIGVTGMTVTQVLGCGVQKGSSEYYRGVQVDFNLLPKVEVEIVVCEVPVETVIETAKKVLHTGKVGDGKIFVYNVEEVVRIRTGEKGCKALQD